MTSIPDIFGTMAYGPAPEAVGPAQAWLEQHGRRFGLFIGGRLDAGRGRDVRDPQPRDGQAARQADAGDGRRRGSRPCARRAAPSPAGGSWAATAGRATCTRSRGRSRSIAGCSRCSRRSTTASPSARSRDIDIPLVARHFYHHAGWAQLMDAGAAGTRAGRRHRPDHPVELPAADAGVEDRAGARDGEHGRAQAGRVHLADRAALRRDVPGDRAARRASSTSSPATAARARRSSRIPGVDKIAFTGSTEVGRLIREATAGSGKKLSLELGGKSPFIVFDDADLDSVVEGVVDAIWFNQGQVCCAGSRLLVQEGVAERLVAKLRRAWRRCGSAIRSTRRWTWARSSPRCSSRGSRAWCAGVRRRAPTLWQPSWSCPREGWFYPPTLFTDVAPAATIAQVEIFGPVRRAR